MTTSKAKAAAQHILDDRHGADYYQDTQLLADYLDGTLGITKEEAMRIAKAIQDDRSGANYYEDVSILAEFLGNRA